MNFEEQMAIKEEIITDIILVQSSFDAAKIVGDLFDSFPYKWWHVIPFFGQKHFDAYKKLYRVYKYLYENAHSEYTIQKDKIYE